MLIIRWFLQRPEGILLKNITRVRLFILFFIFSLFLSTVHTFVEEFYFGHSAQMVALENAIKKADERENVFKQFIAHSEGTLKSLRELKAFNQYLSDPTDITDLQNIFFAFSKSHHLFMQLRFIDKNGYEIIRIDKELSIPNIVSKDKLQNKSDRYYFSNSKSKPLEQVWFSDLDLNTEKGVIEVPYRPTLRAILPIKYNDKFGGIIIINYFIEEFLSSLFDAPLYDMILCDGDGFPIKHYDEKKSWGKFRQQQYTIAEDFPNDYKEILSSSTLKTDNFFSKRLNLPYTLNNGIFLIFQLKKSFINKQNERIYNQYFITSVVMFALALLITLFISHYLDKFIHDNEQKLIQMSYIDDLTQLHNRKAYNERIEDMIEESKRYRSIFSMVLLDIDFFKFINDNYGHAVGDHVLEDLSQLIQSTIRSNDYAFRIGGEEFIILLSNTNLSHAVIFAENLRNKIQTELSTIKNKEITVSLGVTEVIENDTSKTIYKRADDYLYKAKESGRNRVVSKDGFVKQKSLIFEI